MKERFNLDILQNEEVEIKLSISQKGKRQVRHKDGRKNNDLKSFKRLFLVF